MACPLGHQRIFDAASVCLCVSGVCVHLTDVELHNSTWLLSKTNWPVEEMHIQHRVGNAERARCIKTLSAGGGAQASGEKTISRYACSSATSWGQVLPPVWLFNQSRKFQNRKSSAGWVSMSAMWSGFIYVVSGRGELTHARLAVPLIRSSSLAWETHYFFPGWLFHHRPHTPQLHFSY